MDLLDNPSLSLMDVDGTFQDFDYANLLQDEDIVPTAEDGSSGSPGSTGPSAFAGLLSSSVTSSSSSALATRGTPHQKQKLERRGHTKSRRGCFNCKRRRIKCQETRPACGHCLKSGLNCEYPAIPQVIHQPQCQIPMFSLQDMRFFQHFLLSCFPAHPLGNEGVWTHEVPCLSQTYEYLMHAILGLSASDLMSQDPSLVTSAMTHRLKAIKAIKKTLTDGPKVQNAFEEGNALMATCFALTFQSVALDDGMAEYMTFCRGIVIVAIQMYCKGAKFIFSNFLGDDVLKVLKPLMEQLSPINAEWTDKAVAGIHALEPLCQHPVEKEFYQLLLDMAEALYTSPFLAYELLCKHYGWWMQIPHDAFQYLIDPANTVCVLLASHWIALKQIMATITETENRARSQAPSRKDKNMDLGMIRWLKYLNRVVDSAGTTTSTEGMMDGGGEGVDYRAYNEWPVWVEVELDRDLGVFGKTVEGMIS